MRKVWRVPWKHSLCWCYGHSIIVFLLPLGQGVLSSCVHPSVCLSVCLLIILDCGQQYIHQLDFTCQIIDTKCTDLRPCKNFAIPSFFL